MSEPSSAPRDATALAATVAHELNNIGASLYGFVELAGETARARGEDAAWLAEIRVGVRRIVTVAALLETLAGVRGEPTEMTLEDCLRDGAAAGDYRLEWRCDAATRIVADAEHVRRVARVLARAAAATSPTDSPPLVVSLLDTDGACLTCGAALRAGDARLDTRAAHALTRAGSPAQAPRRGETGLRRLVNEASAHAAHLAGGHVHAPAGESPPALVLPVAAGYSSTRRGK